MQPAKRLLIWSHEFSHELRDALAQLGFEVVALAQGALAGTLSLSLFELYYGSERIQALGASESRYGALSSEQVRDYSRCVGRLGFVPFNQGY